jgi:hypothetical protein
MHQKRLSYGRALELVVISMLCCGLGEKDNVSRTSRDTRCLKVLLNRSI